MKCGIFIAALIAILAAPAGADTISLKTDIWCPFACDGDPQKRGYVTEIAEQALQLKGYKTTYGTMPWVRVLKDTAAGKADAALAAAGDDVTSNGLIVGKEPVGMTRNCVFAKESSKLTIMKADDLKKAGKIGVITGSSYNAEFDAVLKAVQPQVEAIAGEDALESNIKKLLAGRLDVVLEEEPVFLYTLKATGTTGIKAIGCEANRVPTYIAFSPKNPKSKEYVVALDQAIAEMRANGKLKAILDKYGLHDWK